MKSELMLVMRPTSWTLATSAWSEILNLLDITAVEQRPDPICDDLDTNGVNCLNLGSLKDVKLFNVDGLYVSTFKSTSNISEDSRFLHLHNLHTLY